jgi:membrane-associated phospholipid phosphatase/Na+/melibiose symporter-like transporter
MRTPARAQIVPLPYLVVFGAAALGAGLGRAVTTSYLPYLLDRIEDAPGKIGTVMLVNAAAGLLVPLAVGFWSDRRAAHGGGRRLPFVLGGSLVSAGGLAAVALGFSSSYLVLALFGAVIYVGLNATTTAHRALVPETFSEETRPRATSAQELALLAGGLLGIVVGGGLTALAPWAPFALAAVAVPAVSLPTVARGRESAVTSAPADDSPPLGYYASALRRPGVLGFLLAQVLWVLGYAALPAFFILYAEDVLGLEAASASLFLAGFGVATAAAVLAAGRVRSPGRLRPLLLLGIALMGIGFLLVAVFAELVLVAAALALVAVGFGLISTVGFPLFSALIPEGEAGGYTALFFSVRAIASTIALPTAGWLIAVTDSYRSLFVLGGLATLAALVPLSRGTAARPLASLRTRLPGPGWLAGWAFALAALALVTLALGRAILASPLRRLDEELFQVVNGLGPGPELTWTLLDPHTRNYVILVALAATLALVTRPPRVLAVVAQMLASALVAWILLESVYALYDRPRPEEVIDAVELNGHSWARLESFPSGHLAITAALAVAAAFAFPGLRRALWAYVVAIAFTRVLFGAHFPLDAVAGIALGYGSAVAVRVLAIRTQAGSRSAAPSATPSKLLDRDAVAALMPTFGDVPERELVLEVRRHAGRLLIVDDGSPEAVATELEVLARDTGSELLRLPRNSGKGTAVRAGLEHLLASPDAPDAVLLIDADGQHPPAAIPALLSAARDADLVIGDRFGDLSSMPAPRRVMNRLSSGVLSLATGRAVRDSQSGMRVLRGQALHDARYPDGRYEAETRHLKALLTSGAQVTWVPIPAIYGSETSSFRPLADSYRIARAMLGGGGSPTPRPARARLRVPLPQGRPASSGLPDKPARARPAPQDREAATGSADRTHRPRPRPRTLSQHVLTGTTASWAWSRARRSPDLQAPAEPGRRDP